jgi:hypothetical protein
MYTKRTPVSDVLGVVDSFTKQGVGVTRQTIASALSVPINEVTNPVNKLIKQGEVFEFGYVRGPTGRRRRLLYVPRSSCVNA